MPMRERWTGEYDDLEEIESEGVKDHNKDRSKSSGRRDEKDHRSRDRERSKAFDGVKEKEKDNKDRLSSRDRRKEDRNEREKDKVREKDNDREKHREKEKDNERKDRLKEKDREREREKEKSRDKDKHAEKERDRAKDKVRDRHGDREREREDGKHRGKDAGEREKVKERNKDKEKQADQEKDRDRARDRDRSSRRQKDEGHDTSKDMEKDYSRDNQSNKERLEKSDDENVSNMELEKAEIVAAGHRQSTSELEERISKIREERLKSSEGASDVLSWVNRSRKLEEKRNAEKEKALQLSKVFEEQDNMIDEESDDEAATKHLTHDLGGVKILHGIDKVLEGGAVVLTLKDQSILADGDINQEIDMLENVEIGEQKRRNEAYNAAKKKTGVYDDKFSDEPGAERKMLPQYDDPVADEGVTLDSSGRFTGEAERKLEELRKRILGVSASAQGEDLNSTGKISSDYFTQEEMTKFKKPKKKKSLRKKEKLDIDALEAEAKSAGLGSGDLGSRNDGRRQNLREEQEKIDAEKRASAYQSAYAKAEEASKALRQEKVPGMRTEEDETPVFGDDDEDLRKSLATARKIALKKRDEEEKSGPGVITFFAASTSNDTAKENPGPGDQPENKVVFTEMEEFVWGLQLDEVIHYFLFHQMLDYTVFSTFTEEKKPETEDVFMEDGDVAPSSISDQEMKDEDGGWSSVKETIKDETLVKEEEKEVVPDETIHEAAVGKGLAGALKLLKDRGTLKETIEWGGRNMDKKKSKLVGIYDKDAEKEIRIDRTDEYGRILTPKEAFRQLSHTFHGKGPGKTKQEKRMRQYQEELKVKQMKNSDTPSLSVERMREAQAKLQTPYLVLSGNVKPGQSSDPRSGFATVEKDFAGGLTPMLGDRKASFHNTFS
ncbi:sart-1 family protein dot2 [Phtheirospermum japonicum]|uniref:Sart-1 family protein dot2 n=1 Tax=Phtheirospermum japonicum TaxID=374723 RepID=A0A830B4F8_9LAMI|nr:sart-1 family protein dot2 [Phtheirospermum japonicum]